MAYIWVAAQVRLINDPFTMESDYVTFANRMDQRWLSRHDGCTLATTNRNKYRVYYEPDVPYGHENQQTRPIQASQANQLQQPFVFRP